MVIVINVHGQLQYPLYLWTYGKIQITFQNNKKPLFSEEEKQRELLRRLNEIDGINLPSDAITKQPAIALSDLRSEQALGQFLSSLDWMVTELRAD